MKKKLITAAALAVATSALVACSSGLKDANDAGINVSYADYYKMCDVNAGKVVRNMDVERTWTSAQHSELWDIIAADPDCQPDN